MADTDRSENIVGIFLKLTSIEGTVYRFQNFLKDMDFIYENDEYEFLPMEYNPPERNITLDNTETSLTIPAIPLIVGVLESNNFFINALIESFVILRGFPSIPVISEDKQVITGYQIKDIEDGTGGISLNIASPFNTVNGRFPNIFYSTGFGSLANQIIGYIPEVPLNNSVAIS
jgi:hypothetical protein